MLFILLTLVIILISWLILDATKPINYPPGPIFLPIIGNYSLYRKSLKVLGYHHLVWSELSKKYGDIVGLKLGRHLVVTVFGAEAVKEVLSREEFDGRPDGFFFRLRTFGKRLVVSYQVTWGPYGGQELAFAPPLNQAGLLNLCTWSIYADSDRIGIVFSDGQFWRNQRKFSLQHLRNFGFGRKEMELKIQEETRCLIDIFSKNCGQPIFMHSAFDVSVLNVLWAMTAGQRFEIEDERLKTLLKIIHDAFRLVDMSGGLINQMPFLRHVAPNACGYNQIMDVLQRMWQFLEEAISEHRRTVCFSQPRDLIDAFLQKMDVDNDSSYTDDQLMSLCLDLFMAGAETTSNTLGFAMLYMILFPEVQNKVRNELDTEVGRNRWPSLNDRARLKYTEAVLMEVQRRTNIAPLGIAHRAVRNTQLLGYNIPRDTMLLTSLYSVHMDEVFWKDPSIFRPERFLSRDGEIVDNEKYFIPFGQGKRRCLGESLGKANIFLFFTAVIHNFYVEAAEDHYPRLEGFDGVTIAPKPFKARLVPRID